ncbi:GNAT family N-acetyltransferase [Nakamurella sp. A5-74]|uniref:GNAT family N-acetyltransferase n=1 Tax=Nakamurella sp. A5-74 TaxID=3158264 RepID=A0AAU8DQE9_9ACTN
MTHLRGGHQLLVDRHTEQAAADAEAAAAAAGVRIVDVHDVDGFEDVRVLFDAVWQPDPGDEPVTRGLLNALVHCGNYCSAAFVGDRMVAASMGFLGLLPEPLLHSHITAVLPDRVGSGVGRAIKLHQRWWALQRGLQVITWTYDPLIRRNAYFNAVKLGALPVEYLVDFYGEMNDAINAGQGSDRLLSRWDLLQPHRSRPSSAPVRELITVVDGIPVLSEDPRSVATEVLAADQRAAPGAGRMRLSITLPADVEALRAADPVTAARWRAVVRHSLGSLMDLGWRVVDVSRDQGYLMESPEPPELTAPAGAGDPVQTQYRQGELS